MRMRRHVGINLSTAAVAVAVPAALVVLAVLASPGVGLAKTTVKFWHDWSGEGGDAVKAIVEDFNRTQDRVEVKLTYTPNLSQKLLTAVAAGAAPDAVLFDRYMTANFAARKVLTPLDAYLKEDGFQAGQFFKATWQETLYGGKSYSVPFSTDCRVLFYNKQLFQNAGLDDAHPPKTWDDLRAYSKKLTRKSSDGKLTQLGYVPTWDGVSLVHYIWQNDGDVFDDAMDRDRFNDKAGQQALRWVVDFMDDYGTEALTTFGASFANNLFYGQKVAMKSDGCWMYGDLKQNGKDMLGKSLGLSDLPYNKTPATIAGGFALVIPDGAKQKDAAWEFIKHAISRQSLVQFTKATGSLPALRSASSDDSISRDSFLKPFVGAMEYARYRPTHPSFPDIEPSIYEAVANSVNHKGAPAALLDAAAEYGQKILDRYNKHFRK